jgi:F-type H+-transporting ATPase subunit a
MMSANQRGAIAFVIIILVAWFFCGVLPTQIMPSNGIAMALPVIQVPGEILWEGAFFGADFTNTFMGLFATDVVVLLIAAAAWAASKGWTNEIPGKFQALIEFLVESLYNLVKGMAGTATIVRTQLFPLVASIFFFLLIANWMELIPGVDSIGLKHCAHAGMNGYPLNGNTLYNTRTIFTGYPVTSEAQYEACHHALESHSVPAYDAETEETINELAAELNAVPAEGEEPLSDEARATLAHEYEEVTGYHLATAYLTAEELERGILPYSVIVTPFIRAAATDMNLTFALAVISIIAIQYFGVAALGIGYFQKFVNINALGNANKRPMGLMDFGVGLFEIISEIAKMISLSFRLFGNIFAGQLLLFIITFLVATLLPVAIYGLEFAVGMIQALVFGMLTLVFSAQAMVSHAHDDEEHH